MKSKIISCEDDYHKLETIIEKWQDCKVIPLEFLFDNDLVLKIYGKGFDVWFDLIQMPETKLLNYGSFDLTSIRYDLGRILGQHESLGLNFVVKRGA